MPLLTQVRDVSCDSYHGREVFDRFRWLEDRSRPATKKWIRRQQESATRYFDDAAQYPSLAGELRQRLDVDMLDEPVRVSGTLICRIRRRGDERPSIYASDSSDGVWRVLVDAAKFAPTETINLYRVSSDASMFSYLKREGGSDQASVHCLDVLTGASLGTTLERGYARGLVLSPSRQGWFHCHEQPSARQGHQVLFAGFSGTRATRVILQRPRSDGSKLILMGNENRLGALHAYETAGTRRNDFWAPDADPEGSWRLVFENLSPSSIPLVCGERLLLLDRPASGGFLLTECNWDGQELRRVAADQRGDIRSLACSGAHLYASCQQGMVTEIRYWSWSTGAEGVIKADAGETVRLVQARANGDTVFFTRESYTRPAIVFEHSAGSACTAVLEGIAFDTQQQVSEANYVARDGVSIPITVVGCREERKARPVIVLVYGAFGSSLLPQFSILFSLLLEMGALLVVLHARGGGEKGRAWHDAGKRRNKIASIFDVIDGIEWLRGQSYVDSNRVALYGASAGGLLVAAAAMKIPERLRAVVCIGPLLDMLRYHRFGMAARWKEEFGTSECSKDFEALQLYSPYQNVTPTSRHPALLFVTGDEDDRCDPAHVRKMVAHLQESWSGNRSILVDYGASRGHTPGLPFRDRVETLSRRCAFLARELDLSLPERCA